MIVDVDENGSWCCERPVPVPPATAPMALTGTASTVGAAPPANLSSSWPASIASIARPGHAMRNWPKHTSDVMLARYLGGVWQRAGLDLVGDLGELHYYDAPEGVWRPVPREFLGVQINSFDGVAIKGNPERVVEIKDHRVKGIVNRLYDEVHHPRFFDEAPRGIAFRNGFLVVDATGATLHPPSKDHRARFALACDWDPHATAPLYTQYLEDVFECDEDADAKRAVLQEWTGGALGGISTDYERALMPIGQPGSGKSVFAFVVKSLFPPSAVTAIAPHQLANDYKLAALANAALNVPTELPTAEMVATETWKAVNSGDYVSARNPYGRVFGFHPRAAHLVPGNNLPTMNDETSAAFDRALIVTFDRQFRGTTKQVVGLRDQIVERELAGVAAWAVAGAVRLLQQRRYTHVPSAVEAATEWRQESTPVLQWIAERCEPSSDETIVGVLYDDFRKWCEKNGNKPPSKATLGRKLKRAGYPSRPGTNNVRLYRLTLRPIEVRLASYQVRALPGGKGMMFAARVVDVDDRELSYEFVAVDGSEETDAWRGFASAFGGAGRTWKQAAQLVQARARAILGPDGLVISVTGVEAGAAK
jgi:P4 family phage/plasmid primase-like protien